MTTAVGTLGAPSSTTRSGEGGGESRRRPVTGSRRPGHVASAILLGLTAVLSLGACRSGPEFSHFTVYNQTTVPIVFSTARNQGRTDYYVLPCSSAQFIYGSGTNGWDAVDPSAQPSPRPTNAVRFEISPGPLADANMDTTWWMTSTGSYHGPGTVVPSLPPCEGVPPRSDPRIITPPPTIAP